MASMLGSNVFKQTASVLMGACLAFACVSPGFAQAPKFNRCLTPAEAEADQLVRHGVLLREASNRCEALKPGTKAVWQDFATRFGTRLQTQTDKRAKLFQREFKDDATKVMTYFDGRMVTYFRHYPLSTAYCEGVNGMLDEVKRKGWRAYKEQAKKTQNQTMLDFKVCN